MKQKKISPQFFSTRLARIQMVTFGQHGFLFDKKGISVRKTTLYANRFKKVEFTRDQAMHFDFNQSFNLKDKNLHVSAQYYTTYGPLGDRVKLNATYDGEIIGNYSSLRSYMGGGANGVWPSLVNEDWQLIFVFDLQYSSQKKFNHFSINYFETLLPFSNERDNNYFSIKEDSINLAQLEERFSTQDIAHSKVLEWEHQIKDAKNNDWGKISCFSYPGFQRYRFSRYGTIPNWEEYMKIHEPFISREIENSGCLYVLEFQTKNNTEVYLPWDDVRITGRYK